MCPCSNIWFHLNDLHLNAKYQAKTQTDPFLWSRIEQQASSSFFVFMNFHLNWLESIEIYQIEIMAKDGDGKDTNDKKKPNLALSMLVEVALAIIVQWKSITECFNTCNSRVELFEKIAYIVLITIGISKPAELIHNLFMKLVDSVWVVITGHPLTPELNPDMEHWFKVVKNNFQIKTITERILILKIVYYRFHL